MITLHLRKMTAQGNWEQERGIDHLPSLCTQTQVILLSCRTHSVLPMCSRSVRGSDIQERSFVSWGPVKSVKPHDCFLPFWFFIIGIADAKKPFVLGAV